MVEFSLQSACEGPAAMKRREFLQATAAAACASVLPAPMALAAQPRLTVCAVGGSAAEAIYPMTQDPELAGARWLAVSTQPPANWPGRRIVLDLDLDSTFRTALRLSLTLGNDRPVAEWMPDDATWAAAAQIREALTGTEHMLLVLYAAGFIAGRAGPIVASIARDMGIHTAAAVAMPFACQGREAAHRAAVAHAAIADQADQVLSAPLEREWHRMPPGATYSQAADAGPVRLRELATAMAQARIAA
jgi:hypothetical protein